MMELLIATEGNAIPPEIFFSTESVSGFLGIYHFKINWLGEKDDGERKS